MSALKKLLKSDTPLGGQGSHFLQDDSQPTTVTGTDPNTAGPSDVSAAPAPASQAHATAGPEAGGDRHVQTVSASDLAGKSGDGSAAIGQTTTYSSQPLASGDPTSSVVDHKSTDPLTYKKPEAGGQVVGNTGVTEEGAAAAAAAAWHKHEEMPGGFPQSPGVENPYKASHPLDPRVDGGKAGDIPPRTAAHTSSTTVAGSGAALGAASLAAKNTTQEAPSTLTSTADPTQRSVEYSKTTETKGLGNDPPQENQGVLGKALGVVGLGSAVGAAAAALGLGGKKEGDDEPHDTSAIASAPGQVSSESGPPKHYRRESIPTTAYPAGPNSPRAIAPPVGGTLSSATESPEAAQQTRESITGEQKSLAPAATGLGLGTATSGVSDSQHKDSSQLRTTVATGSTVHDQTTVPQTEESHTGRNVTAAGLGAGAVGAGAYALHESDQHEPSVMALPDRTRDDPTSAVAAAPARYDAQDAAPSSTTAHTPAVASTDHSTTTSTPATTDDHTARNAALGAGAGAAAIGGTAYAVDQHREEEARKAAAEHEKELAKQREAQAKEAEKAEKQHQKEIEKEEKKAEKEEKKHQKELEKEEKKHQKEIEKAEKKHAKEVEKEEKHHQKELEKEEKQREKEERERQAALVAAKEREDEERKRREREAAAGVATGAAVGAGAVAYDHERSSADKATSSTDHHDSEGKKEKKPNIFKRIFKRRKNKDTGEDEDYSTDDEEDKAKHAAAAAGVGVASGVGAGAGYAQVEEEKHSRVPHHESESKGRNVLGRAPEHTSTDKPLEPTTGLPYDPAKDPEAAARLREKAALQQETEGMPFGDSSVAGVGSSGLHQSGQGLAEKPRESRTGLEYDPSKDPEAARGLSDKAAFEQGSEDTAVGGSDVHHSSKDVVETPAGGHLPVTATEPFGEITDHRR